MYKYVVSREQGKICSYLIDAESDRTVEIHRDPAPTMPSNQEKGQTAYRIGQIYIGRVEQVHLNLGAAFVRIRAGEPACYLPLDQAGDPIYTKKGSSPDIQQGDELIVQIVREPIKTKSAALSAHLMIRGRSLILNTGLTSTSVSKKIAGERKEQLRELALRIASEYHEGKDAGTWNNESVTGKGAGSGHDGSLTEEDAGIRHDDPATEREQSEYTHGRLPWNILIRTNAAQLTDEEIRQEAHLLGGQLEHLVEIAAHRPAGTCLYDIAPAYLERIRDLDRSQLQKVVTDDRDLFDQIMEYSRNACPDISEKLVWYEDPMLSMDKLYSLERRMELAVSRTVLLKAGACLIIEPTEALTVIDVNSSRMSASHKKADKEETALKVNLEAAEEIARQMRLRNMSGIILADFINLEQAESRKTLMMALSGFLAKDPVKAVVVDMTKLNLVEMTRRKAEKPLWET